LRAEWLNATADDELVAASGMLNRLQSRGEYPDRQGDTVEQTPVSE
jgi:hypothetical protein